MAFSSSQDTTFQGRMVNFEAKNAVKQGKKRQKDKWYPIHACTPPPPKKQALSHPSCHPLSLGEISLQKGIALHRGLAATLTSSALHCATKMIRSAKLDQKLLWRRGKTPKRTHGSIFVHQGRALYGPIPVKTGTFRELWAPLVHTFSWGIHMDQSLVYTFSWGKSYGPMVVKVRQKFPPTLVLVHGWLFPVHVQGTRSLQFSAAFKGSVHSRFSMPITPHRGLECCDSWVHA